MEVHLSPDLKAKADRWSTETGRPVEELVEEAMAGYFDELADVRGVLDRRYDELKSGRVQSIDGDEAFALLRAKCEARRGKRRG